jgi:hypothetical protein
MLTVPARDFKYNYLQLQEDDVVVHMHESCCDWAVGVPNPLRQLAQGHPLYTSHVKAWADDVSGNTTKQYNPHLNLYIAHANLPHDKLSQEYFVRFMSTSPHATSAEQFTGLVQQLQ